MLNTLLSCLCLSPHCWVAGGVCLQPLPPHEVSGSQAQRSVVRRLLPVSSWNKATELSLSRSPQQLPTCEALSRAPSSQPFQKDFFPS